MSQVTVTLEGQALHTASSHTDATVREDNEKKAAGSGLGDIVRATRFTLHGDTQPFFSITNQRGTPRAQQSFNRDDRAIHRQHPKIAEAIDGAFGEEKGSKSVPKRQELETISRGIYDFVANEDGTVDRAWLKALIQYSSQAQLFISVAYMAHNFQLQPNDGPVETHWEKTGTGYQETLIYSPISASHPTKPHLMLINHRDDGIKWVAGEERNMLKQAGKLLPLYRATIITDFSKDADGNVQPALRSMTTEADEMFWQQAVLQSSDEQSAERRVAYEELNKLMDKVESLQALLDYYNVVSGPDIFYQELPKELTAPIIKKAIEISGSHFNETQGNPVVTALHIIQDSLNSAVNSVRTQVSELTDPLVKAEYQASLTRLTGDTSSANITIYDDAAKKAASLSDTRFSLFASTKREKGATLKALLSHIQRSSNPLEALQAAKTAPKFASLWKHSNPLTEWVSKKTGRQWLPDTASRLNTLETVLMRAAALQDKTAQLAELNKTLPRRTS